MIDKNNDIFKYNKIPLSQWSSIKRGATSRNLEFTITMEYAANLLISQNMKCILSGVDISFGTLGSKNKTRNYIETTASLDRIDSSKGYVEGNVQWVHKMINTMKWTNSNFEFIKWCQLVTEMNYDESSDCGIIMPCHHDIIQKDIWVS